MSVKACLKAQASLIWRSVFNTLELT